MPLADPQWGTWPATQACALTRNQTTRPFGSQANAQPTEPHQSSPRLCFRCLEEEWLFGRGLGKQRAGWVGAGGEGRRASRWEGQASHGSWNAEQTRPADREEEGGGREKQGSPGHPDPHPLSVIYLKQFLEGLRHRCTTFCSVTCSEPAFRNVPAWLPNKGSLQVAAAGPGRADRRSGLGHTAPTNQQDGHAPCG